MFGDSTTNIVESEQSEISEDEVIIKEVKSSHLSEGSSLVNLIKSNIGTGMLSMPIVFMYTGIWLGIFLILVAGIIATYAMYLLLKTTEECCLENNLNRSKIDYTDAVFYVLKYGPPRLEKYKGKIKHIVNGFLIITQLGFCCVYIVFLSNNIMKMIEYYSPELNSSIYLIGFVVAVVLCPLSLVSNMKVFAVISALANLTTLIGMGLIFVYFFTMGFLDWTQLQKPMGFKEILIGFSIMVFAFEGISLVLPISGKMKNPKDFSHKDGVLVTGMTVVVLSNCILGFFGYLHFGKETPGSITYSIPETPILFGFIKPLFIFSIFITYMLQFFVPAEIFSRLALKIRFFREASPQRQGYYLILMRILLVLMTYGLSMTIPHIDLLLSLIGSLCSSFLAIIIPPALVIVQKWNTRMNIPNFNLKILLPNISLIIFGFFAFLFGTGATIIQIIQVYRTEAVQGIDKNILG